MELFYKRPLKSCNIWIKREKWGTTESFSEVAAGKLLKNEQIKNSERNIKGRLKQQIWESWE